MEFITSCEEGNGKAVSNPVMPPSSNQSFETILDALQTHVKSQGRRNAYTFLTPEFRQSTLTFRELDERARRIAAGLLQHAEPGDRALMMFPAGLGFIEAFLGCLFAGIVAVPAYPPRKNRNAGRIRSIAEDCEPRLLLCASKTRRGVEEELGRSVKGSSVIVTDELDDSGGGPLPRPHPDQLAFVQYTSGSTASPRGVMVSHGNIVANQVSIMTNFRHTTNDVAVSWLPMFHDMGLIGSVLQPLFVGFQCYLMDPSTFIREPFTWLKAISDFRGVLSGAPNFAYDLCVRKVSDQQKAELDLSSWVAFNGAEPVRAETLTRFARAFESCGFRRDAFFPCYGMAEATLFVSGGPPLAATKVVTACPMDLENNRITESSSGQRVVSCGQIGPDLEVLLVDPKTLTACRPDEVGEIWLRGASVARGYWNRPEETREAFHANAYGDDRHWFRTGDCGFLRNGELYVTGRLKDLIVVRGRNLYPQDIEQLVEYHIDFLGPNSCAAFSVEHDGEERLIVVAEGTRDMARWARSNAEGHAERVWLERAIDDLRREVLDQFEVALARLIFVRPATFPRTSSGKLQRRLTRRMLSDGALDVVLESAVRRPDVVEMHPAEHEVMTSLICETLREWAGQEGQSLPALNGKTTFTSLGVDSMAAADLGLRLEKKLSLAVDGEMLYLERTIENLAAQLARRLPSNAGRHGEPSSTKSGFVHSLQDALHRFQQFEDAGHDYFATEIEHQEGSHVWVGGLKMLMMASYSYLGLINRDEVNEAARKSIESHGTGAHGVRLLAGTFHTHCELEREIAAFFATDDAIVFSSGFISNLATVAALVGEGDVVIGDEYNHASIADGCKFSEATFLTFPHNDTRELEILLKQHAGKKILVVVDAVYSMDGDVAPLPEIAELCHRHGALLMVDEAHSLGVMGETGRGIQEHFNLPADAIDIKMGTLSKAIASCGGFIAARQEIIDYLKFHARGFIFSAALPAAQVGAARKCLEIIRDEPYLAGRLRELRDRFVSGLRDLGFEVPPTDSAIVPILFRSEEETLEAVGFCRARGLFVVPVFYPAVPMDRPRIRATVMASFSDDDLNGALKVFEQLAAARSAASVRSPSRSPGGVRRGNPEKTGGAIFDFGLGSP
ncbi:aminotransferase class I/II-fold pyridoxal phosphate-dependent enzyme [Tautonia marina]|uniref:aminotransferase class I/II-fold pyridoxal phosphate-dependent enzyme n=1 Tax=Tautonia marina TaxID=2653855 RepID=UPI001375EEAF|nr:aminotransferase class I/II-fold pyridoxal phosphate-dependent enzyme [Tautonia marina]